MSVARFRARRACRAREAGFFSMDQFLMPRRFQRGITRPWAGSASAFGSAGTDGRTDPDRENGHYENIYIDDQSGPPISELKLLVVRIYKVSLADE